MSQNILQPSVELHHCLRLTTNRSDVVGRRDFLRGITVAGLAAGTLSWTDLMMAQATELRKRGMACILLWMQGGPSQFETFSPKPDHPNGGPTKAIATAVPGIQICENYPQLAKQMADIAIIRSMTSREGSHPRGTYFMHTGYIPSASVKYPSFGAAVAHEIGDPKSDLPSFVRINAQGQQSASTGGFLGVPYDPFEMPNPGQMPNNTTLTTGVDRYQRRMDLLNHLEQDFASSARDEVENHQKQYDRAAKLILSPKMKTFDLSQETDAMREAYGKTKFGSGCLLARRLVEAGVTFIEINLNGWDTHADNFAKTKTLAGELDQPVAQLIADLKQRGLFDSTVIMWTGEFGRTPKINPRGGRDHFPKAFNALVAGGGIRGGQVIGETDKSGSEVTAQGVNVHDLYQTVCAKLKINAAKENMSPIGRPIKVVDGGQPIKELVG